MAKKSRTDANHKKPETSEQKKVKSEQDEQKKFMESIRVGNRDINNNVITRVHLKDKEFAVYEVDVPILTDSLKTVVYTVDDKEESQQIIKNLDKVTELMSDVEDVMSKAIDKSTFKGRMASAIGQALLGNVDDAKRMFEKLMNQANNEYLEQQRDRSFYRGSALIFCVLIVSFALYTCSVNPDPFLPLFKKMVYVAAGGSIGGFLSINIAIRNIVFEQGIPRNMVIFYALERIIFAIFAAAIVVVAIKLNMVLGFLNTSKNLNNATYGYVIASVIAGFSETFLPNLLVKLEKKS